MAKRVAGIVVALVLLAAAHLNDSQDGRFLGYYPFDSAQRSGSNAFRLALDAFCVWLIYRGITGPKKGPPVPPL